MRARARPLFLRTVFQILFQIFQSNGKNENPKRDISALKAVFGFRVRLQIRNPDFKILIQISQSNAPLAIFREWINNDQRATTTPLSVGIESCSLKYFSDTKFVYRKIVELLVLVVTHLLQEFAFSQKLSALIIFNFWSASHVYCTSWETYVIVCFIKIGHKIRL